MFKLHNLEYIADRNVIRLITKIFNAITITIILKNIIKDNKSYQSTFFKSLILIDLYFKYNKEKYKYSMEVILLKFIHINFYLNDNIEDLFFKKKWYLSQIIELDNTKINNDTSFINEISTPIDIIIPVYNGFEYLNKLFQSIYKSTNIDYRLIIIEDKSTDKNILPFLEKLDFKDDNHCKDFILIKNEKNLGFVKTINKASKLVNNHFVLLNTDIELPKNWLERLIKPLYANKDLKISSVTPFTNSGVFFSYPIWKENNELINNLTLTEIDNAFNNINPIFNKNIIIHSGTGYCMAINYQCWNEIGEFDEKLFEKGYGEENDWCFRAIQKGYINILAPNLFVYHKHSGSFGNEEREKLMQKHLAILIDKYPKEIEICRQFDIADPFKIYRLYANIYISKQIDNNLLFIDFETDSGGAHFYSKNRVNEFVRKGYNIIFIKHNFFAKTFKLSFYNINDDDYIYVNDILELKYIFGIINIKHVFINNLVFMNTDNISKLFSTILEYKKIYNFYLEYVFHDFFSICKSFFLINNENKYCNTPNIEKCQQCINTNSHILEKDFNIIEYRKLWNNFFINCNKLICFSNSSYNIINNIYTNIKDKLSIIPHDILINYKEKYNPNWNNDILNIGFFGNFHFIKGADIILKLNQLLQKSSIKYNINIFGAFDNYLKIYKKKEYANIKYIGIYDRNEIPNLLNKYNIDIVIFPSICPETFSYVVQEIIESNAPIIAFNLGAHAERISNYKKGYIADDISADAMYKKILDFYKNK